MSIKNSVLEKNNENDIKEKHINNIEKNQNLQISNKSDSFKIIKQKSKLDVLAIFLVLLLISVIIFIIMTITVTYTNINNTKIYSGIKIKNVDVSNMTKQEAINKVKEKISQEIPEEINFTHLEYKTAISTDELNIQFDINEAVEIAYSIGRTEGTIKNNFVILVTKLLGTNINPALIIDEEKLVKHLDNISSKLPDKIIDNSYYIEDNKLIITKGKQGAVIDTNKMILLVEENINKLNIKNDIELITRIENPKEIDIQYIYNQIYKKPQNAYYTQNPYAVYPSENGLDFNITLDQAKQMLQENKDEYEIPLKTLYPEITTNMIGEEAFPDLLSSFSTAYVASDKNRTTNLILAANKINGTVLMPGETFSYNTVVRSKNY